MTRLFLSKKTILALIIGFSLVNAGTASAGIWDFVKPQKSLVSVWPVPNNGDLQIAVKSPNGGEEWKAGEKHVIEWAVDDIKVQQLIKDLEGKYKDELENYPYPRKLEVVAFLTKGSQILPLGDNVSDEVISLMPRKGFHYIGRADLYDKKMEWTIPSFIPKGNDYKVRLVAVWAPLLRPLGNEKPAHAKYKNLPRTIAADESDGPFTIFNEEITEKPNVEELVREVQSLRAELKEMRQGMGRVESLLAKIEGLIRNLLE